MISIVEIAWLTGLLEGEGTFLMSGRAICIAVNMTDRDIVERAAGLLGGTLYGPFDRTHVKPTYLPIYRAQVKGPKAAGWMMTMYPRLGRRRRGQVTNTLRRWRAMPYVRTSPIIERAIVDAWDSGGRNKLRLAKTFGMSRGAVYRILTDAGRLQAKEAPRRIANVDIAWLAGLFEGEGSVSINGRSLTLRIKMTDEDVIAHAASVLGGAIYYDAQVRSAGRKPTWTVQVKGELAAGWAMTLYPWLGRRRREQARQAIDVWRGQGRGVISPAMADAILSYRRAGYCQADIMDLLKVSKSSVYRHTKGHVRRMRIANRRPSDGTVRERLAPYCATRA